MHLERETELVELAKKGDQDAYRQLVEHNQRNVYGLALRYTGKHDDADEIAQETFIRAYRGLPRFQGGSRFRTWLFRIAVNCCLSHKRKAARHDAVLGFDENERDFADEKNPSPLRSAVGWEVREKVGEALEGLSKKQKAVFVMKYLQHQTIAEISETLGCAPGTVKKQLFRAVGRMRQRLAPLLGIEES